MPGDIREEPRLDVIDRALKELGGLDILVNNAAYQMSQETSGLQHRAARPRPEDQRLRDVRLCKAAIPHMEPGSTIINTASVQGFNPSPHLLDYATTKANLAFTKALGAELAEKGIRVNARGSRPGVDPLIPATMDAGKVGGFGEESPLGRPAQPAELPRRMSSSPRRSQLHHRGGHRRDRRLADRLR